MWRFKEDCGFLACSGCPELTFALPTFDREKSAEAKLLRRESGTDECGQDRRRPGNDREGQVTSDAFANQSRAGIGKPWRSGVSDKGNGFARREALDQLSGAHRFIVLVITEERLLDSKMLQQHPRMSRIFRRDQMD